MNRLLAEFEIFCHITETKPHIVYVPMLWLVFCGVLAFFVSGLSLEPSHMFYDFVQYKLQKSQSKIIVMGVVGYFMFTWALYQKQRKRLF